MEKNDFISLASKLALKFDEWLVLEDIESIELNDGTALYPDMRHLRFRIDKKGNIDVLYGTYQPFGAILFCVGVSYNMMTVRVNGSSQQIIRPTEFYDNYDLPKTGDILRLSKNGKTITETPIMIATYGYNMSTLELVNPLKATAQQISESVVSFYDANKMRPMGVCGTIKDGIYLNFVPNPIPQKLIKTDYHQRVKVQQIKQIKIKYGIRTNKSIAIDR